MNEKAMLKRKIFETDFALYELALFLDTHPESKKAMELIIVILVLHLHSLQSFLIASFPF